MSNIPDIMSRQDAINSGASFYFTGKKCKYGHVSKRNTISGSCEKCRMIRQKESRRRITEIQRYVAEHGDDVLTDIENKQLAARAVEYQRRLAAK
jgi:Zn-finger protein